jgi:hypothetical protein
MSIAAGPLASPIAPQTSAVSRPTVEASLAIGVNAAHRALADTTTEHAGASAASAGLRGADAANRTSPPCSSPDWGAAARPGNYQARSRLRSLAMLWLCSWQTRLSVTFSTAAISFRFMSCS